MRSLARLFVVLFCLVFLTNQAQATFPDLVTIIGNLIKYTTAVVDYFEVCGVIHSQRLNAIEAELAQISDFRVTSAQAEKWKRDVKAKMDPANRARIELLKSLE